MMKMKRRFLFPVLFACILLLTGCVSGADSEGATGEDGEKIVLRVGTGFALDHIWMEAMYNPWMEKVEADSNGRVEFEVFASGELVSLGKELDALNSGTVDLALPLINIYDSSRFPLSEISLLPLTESDFEITNEAYANLINGDHTFSNGKTFYETEFEPLDLKVWAGISSTPFVINTTGKKFETVSDFQNASIRGGTRLNEIFLNNIGASPVSMPQHEAYDALSRGTIEGNIMTIADWTGWGFQDLFTYALEGANIGHSTAVFGMKNDTWNELPEDIQTIMENAAIELQSTSNAKEMVEVQENEVREITKDTAEFDTVDNLNPEVQELISDAMTQTWLDWIDLIEEQGLPGKEVALRWRDLIIEAGGSVPEELIEME